MRFDPVSDTIARVWACDYIYGQTFVGAASWVHDMLHLNHGDRALLPRSVWTQNTP